MSGNPEQGGRSGVEDVLVEPKDVVGDCFRNSQNSQNDSKDSVNMNGSGDGKAGENLITAPVLSLVRDPELVPDDALRSPPKLQPAVEERSSFEEAIKNAYKPLTGSMRNTPASLSIISAPSSTSGKPVRSTRSSIDPNFAAKQRNFLHKVHIALSSAQTDDTSSCESDSEVTLDDPLNGKYKENIHKSEDVLVRRMGAPLNGAIKRKREESQASKGKMGGGVMEELIISAKQFDDKIESSPLQPKRILASSLKDNDKDIYCWCCHYEGTDLQCGLCPRSYHIRCFRRPVNLAVSWVCPDCTNVMRAENQETRSKALKMLTLDQLCKLLQFAVDRMKYCSGAEVFENPVDVSRFPTYKDHIVNPMCLSLLEKNIKRKMYGSTEAFVADASWIVHNCIVFNSANSKLSAVAKNILRVCKQEMAEIENCPDCYKNAYAEDEKWFIKVCRKPHLLVWAKLKGFPFWPAKAMRSNSDLIDVRFFGAHDRAWVQARECYLYSQENPNSNASNKLQQQQQNKKKNPKNNLDTCIEEVELHVKLLQESFSEFRYAPLRTPVHAKKLDDHLKLMLPQYDPSQVLGTATTDLTPPKRSLDAANLAPDPISQAKKMKTDSSVLLQKDLHEDIHVAQTEPSGIITTVEENGSPCEEVKCLLTKSPSVSKIEAGPGNHAQVSGCVPKSDLNSISATPQSSPEIAIIAEQRLKKKDVRKIGLVDRIQEKLSLWVSSTSGGLADDSKTSRNELDKPHSQNDHFMKVKDISTMKSSSKNPLSVDRSVVTEQNTNGNGDVSLTNQTKSKESSTSSPSSPSQEENKRDLFAGAKQIQSDTVSKLLQSYNMSKTQPKVVVQKLIFNTNARRESLDSDSKKLDQNPSKKAIVSAAVGSDSKPPRFASESIIEDKSLVNQDDRLSPPAEVRSLPDEKVTQSTIMETFPSPEKSNDNHSSKPLAEPSSFKKITPLIESEVHPSDNFSIKNLDAPTIEPKEKAAHIVRKPDACVPEDASVKLATELLSQEQEKSSLVSVVNKSAEMSPVPAALKLLLPKKNTPKALSIMLKTVSRGKEQSQKVVRKPFSERTVTVKHPLPDSPIASVEVGDSSVVSINPKSDTLGVKSIPSSDERVSTEASVSVGVDSAVKGTMPETSNSSSKTTLGSAVLVKSGNIDMNGESPSKTFISPKIVNAVSQRTIPPATSILKIKHSPPNDQNISVVSSSSGQTFKLPASQIFVRGGHGALSITQTASSASNQIPPASKTSPTFVTVTQLSQGAPIVRKLVPKAIPLAPVSASVSVSGGMPPPTNSDSLSNLKPPTLSSSDTSLTVTSSKTVVDNVSSDALPSHSVEQESLSKVKVVQSTVNHVYPTMMPASEPKVSAPSTYRAMPSLTVASVGNLPPVPVKEENPPGSSSPSPVATAESQKSKGQSGTFDADAPCKGLLSTALESQAKKMTEVFMDCLKDCMSNMGSKGYLEAQVRSLQLEMERLQWRHKQEIEEIRHNTETLLTDIQEKWKLDVQHTLNLALVKASREKDEAVEATKLKQWCAFCKKEAMFYCCWNTSYCNHQCQQNHWPVHSVTCTQNASAVVDQGQELTVEIQPTNMRRIVTSQKEVLSPPLLKKR